MHERWRYALPCGHRSYKVRATNPPEKRYSCDACQRHDGVDHFYGEDELIDLQKQDMPSGVTVDGE